LPSNSRQNGPSLFSTILAEVLLDTDASWQREVLAQFLLGETFVIDRSHGPLTDKTT
jgi:hypothetical protein